MRDLNLLHEFDHALSFLGILAELFEQLRLPLPLSDFQLVHHLGVGIANYYTLTILVVLGDIH